MNMFTQTVRLSLAGCLMAGIASLGGCKSDNNKPAAEAPAPVAAAPAPAPAPPVSLGQIKGELLEAKAQILATTESLNKLQKSGTADATANYNAFTEQYLRLKNESEQIKARSADLRTRASSYLAAWNKQTDVQNEALRRQAVQQRADAEKLFNNISNEMEMARIEFGPYMSNLTDVGKYLNKNLTPASLQSTSELVAKANDQAGNVNKHIDAIVVGVDQMAAATGESAAVPAGMTIPATPAAAVPADAVPATPAGGTAAK